MPMLESCTQGYLLRPTLRVVDDANDARRSHSPSICAKISRQRCHAGM